MSYQFVRVRKVEENICCCEQACCRVKDDILSVSRHWLVGLTIAVTP